MGIRTRCIAAAFITGLGVLCMPVTGLAATKPINTVNIKITSDLQPAAVCPLLT